MRVLVTGMGGQLGTRVALLLEARADVTAVLGIDVDPPRRRVRAAFHRIDPRDRRRVVKVVREFEPEAVLHAGIYEPDARSTPRAAEARTRAGTLAMLGAAAEAGALRRLVVRSGIEVYGRRRGSATVPDESVPPDPTSHFGRMLLEVERLADAAGRSCFVPVTAVRMGPVAGPHAPSPLARYLRLPVVPFAAMADPSFSVLHQEDAARAMVAALDVDHDGAVNVVGAGAVTAAQAARLGGRVPFPLAGPGWNVARRVAEVLGAPVPDHVVELLRRGRAADGTSAASVLGLAPEHSTVDVVKAVYEWAPVTPLRVAADEDAA